ncbi:putative Zf-FLZ domain, FCS-Like Zinc finger 8/MARD1 [Dioscorea sansibarensis]
MSENPNQSKLLSSILSQRSSSLESETSMSPTSILESKPFSAIKTPRKNLHWDNFGTKGIGLGIIDSLTNDETNQKFSNKMIVFGTQLKIQIPRPQSISIEPLNSPIEFGIKTKEMQLALYSPAASRVPETIFTGCLSRREMELSEDYTCIITHGPNPKTTHIFDNCIIESCVDRLIPPKKNDKVCAEQSEEPVVVYPSESFLSHCYSCKKSIALGEEDIYIYRGEHAFCTEDCRTEGIIIIEKAEEEEKSSLKTEEEEEYVLVKKKAIL